MFRWWTCDFEISWKVPRDIWWSWAKTRSRKYLSSFYEFSFSLASSNGHKLCFRKNHLEIFGEKTATDLHQMWVASWFEVLELSRAQAGFQNDGFRPLEILKEKANEVSFYLLRVSYLGELQWAQVCFRQFSDNCVWWNQRTAQMYEWILQMAQVSFQRWMVRQERASRPRSN